MSDSSTTINEAMDEVSAAAAVDDVFETDAVDRLAVEHFPGKIVRKDLTALMKRGANVPTFVLEYLLGMYCSTDDPVAVEGGLERIRGILLNNYVRPDESEVIKSKIRELGSYTVIDKVSARLDEHSDVYVAHFTNLSIEPFIMPAEYVRQYTKILQGGIWCILRIQYTHPIDDDFADPFEEPAPVRKRSKKNGPEDSPFSVISLTPIQMPNLDLDAMIAERRHFTCEQWEALLLRSAGYEPTALSEKERLHFIERMVPLAERNYNLCELGPRGTGKSHIYKEVSPYAILLSGGQTTTANLFGRVNAKGEGRLGLVGLWDCVTFDEVAGMNFKDANAVQILKDYMASGSYARGRDMLNADASIVLEGNINDSVQNVLKTTHLFDPFPPEFNDDSAFFDRIHCYLPGWEIPKMRSNLLTEHYGLITDCLSEFCKEMRRKDFTHLIDRHFRLNSDFNKRDEIAVGLGYYDVDDPTDARVVGVPEQSDGALIPDAQLLPGHVFGIGHSAASGECAVYKLENRAVAGDFHLQTEGLGGYKAVKEAIKAAWQYFENNAARVAPGMHINKKDYLLFFNDLQGKGASDEVSLAEFVGLCSAAANRPVSAALVIPGVLRMSGTMGELRDLEDIMRVARNAGARRILLPMSAIRDLQGIAPELISAISPDFYPDGDAVAAARKALEL